MSFPTAASLVMLMTAVVTAAPMNKLTPVPMTQVKFTDEFWAARLETNRTVTVWHNLRMCEQTGRVANFDRAAGREPGGFASQFVFDDSDVYKAIEAASLSLALHRDPDLEAHLDRLIERIGAAQQPDGYLMTWYVLKEPGKRWTNIKDMHELYCAGHLMEAAVAHHRATGKRNLLDIAIRFADHIDSVFGPGKKQEPCGHEEVELALMKLAEVTGDEKYLKLAKWFIDIRGRADTHKLFGVYHQDHKPLAEQDEPVGHAVRAMYFYCAATDVAARTGEQAYVEPLNKLFARMVERKMYITGGVGSRHSGEAFGEDYELPNGSAYNETCASIGNALWNHRMNLLTGDAKHFDVVERVLYNGFLSGISLNGDRFFYVNPLASRGKHHRVEWFPCSCCPPNVARVFPQVAGMVYGTSGDAIYVNLYAQSEATVDVAGQKVKIRQETKYPWDGKVKISIDPEKEGEFAMMLRIPGWCKGVKGADSAKREGGYVAVRRSWKLGDSIEFEMEMLIERVKADPKVKANVGRVALQRGPVVYAAEAVDNGGRVFNLALPPDAKLTSEHENDLLGGVTVIKGKALARGREGERVEGVNFTAIPYYAWDHRAPGEMAVWLPEEVADASFIPTPTIATSAKASASHVSKHDKLDALNDEHEMERSDDLSVPRFTWWDHKGTKEWVQYDFAKPAEVSEASVYWFEDSHVGGGCRAPQSWRVMYRAGGEWKPVQNVGEYTVSVNQYNRVEFKKVMTDALRVEVQLQPKFSGGILEWRVK